MCVSRYCVNGSTANWPNEPAAAEMPSAMLRFSGGNARPSTPDTTEKVTPESPVPIRTPAVRTIISGVAACAIVTRPRPYRMVPPINTRPAPYLSAIIPTNGCVTPQTRF